MVEGVIPVLPHPMGLCLIGTAGHYRPAVFIYYYIFHFYTNEMYKMRIKVKALLFRYFPIQFNTIRIILINKSKRNIDLYSLIEIHEDEQEDIAFQLMFSFHI